MKDLGFFVLRKKKKNMKNFGNYLSIYLQFITFFIIFYYLSFRKGVKEGCICQQGSISTRTTPDQLYHPYIPFHLERPKKKHINYTPSHSTATICSEENTEVFKKPTRTLNKSIPVRKSNRRSVKLKNETATNYDQDRKNKSSDVQKNVRFENTDTIENIEIKSLDDIINTQSIADYLDLN